MMADERANRFENFIPIEHNRNNMSEMRNVKWKSPLYTLHTYAFQIYLLPQIAHNSPHLDEKWFRII